MGQQPLIIAHRGAADDMPENTLVAFSEAWRQGADGIEADFRLTRDDHVVCIHDADTGRCGDRVVDVAESTLEELRAVDVGSWKHTRFSNQRVPTLRQVLLSVPAGKRLFIEIKGGPGMVGAVAKQVRDSRIGPEQVAVIAFDQEVVVAARREMPEATVNWLVSPTRGEDGDMLPRIDVMLETLDALQASGIGLRADREVITAKLCADFREAGHGVHCWTVNDPAEAGHFAALGIDSITTDRPGEMVRAF